MNFPVITGFYLSSQLDIHFFLVHLYGWIGENLHPKLFSIISGYVADCSNQTITKGFYQSELVWFWFC